MLVGGVYGETVSVNPPPNTSQGNCLGGTNHAHPGFNSGNADKTGYNMPGGLCAGTKITDGSGGIEIKPLYIVIQNIVIEAVMLFWIYGVEFIDLDKMQTFQ